MVIMAPADENECRQMLHTGLTIDGPSSVRYPRGAGSGVETVKHLAALPIGKGVVVRESGKQAGHRIAILAFGTMVAPSIEAGDALDATVANMRFVKPVDDELIRQLAETHDMLVTIEEGCVMGGAGTACVESLLASGLSRPVLQLGLPDRFIDHGDPVKLLSACGLDAAGIAASVRQRFFAKDVSGEKSSVAKRVA
jgi:1-deoxy-D-xylulose-5-phosphate synthase